MYVDPRPVSTFGQTQGWKMPSPQPTGTLRRPPILKSGSSSSSLKGMEQSIPSFQSFIKRTPPLDPQKPLPPTPLRPRRASSFDSGSSRPSSSFGRRSSSIYSRTVSQWDPDWDPQLDVPDVPALPDWSSVDFADQNNLLLRPIAYSASTSQLLENQQQPQLLEPRAYNPLINTPSPTVSQGPTPAPSPLVEPRPSVLLPPPPAPAHVPKQHLRTVSLEKAKELMQAPGAVHLLPEELRAQTLGKSRSQEPLRVASMDIFAGDTPPEVPVAPTLIDTQGRERLIVSPRASVAPSGPEYPFPTIMSPVRDVFANSFHVGKGPVRTIAPIPVQTRQQSQDKVVQALGLDSLDEPRGRTMTRGPRNMFYDHYLPNTTPNSNASDDLDHVRSNAQQIAHEYHSLLNEQYRQPSEPPASKSSDSETDVRTHMKMVPQPLFHTKPAARLPDERSSLFRSNSSVSPFHMRTDSGFASNLQQRSSSGRGSYPLRLSTDDGWSHKRRSTSGSIPISPPSASTPKKVTIVEAAEEVVQPRKQAQRLRRNSNDNRVSLYYPHIMSRKPKKDKKDKGKAKSQKDEQMTPPLPMLATDIIAQGLKTPESTPDSSPLRSNPPYSDMSNHIHTASLRSDRSSRPLHQRVLKGAAKHADKLARSSESPSRKRSEDSNAMVRVASPESPHLLPSPASVKPPPLHLGWSDHAKSRFHSVRSSVQSPRYRSEPVETHVTTPARPLDDGKTALNEPESPTRKGSIFGGLIESWRESKAEKRRKDLKKMIKHATPEEAESEDAVAARPVGPPRRLSAFSWM